MGFTQAGAGAMAKSRAFPGDDGLAGPDLDPDPHGIAAGLGTNSPILPDALGGDGFPVPAIESENAVGLVDDVPALDIGEGATSFVAGLDEALGQLAGELPDLCWC